MRHLLPLIALVLAAGCGSFRSETIAVSGPAIDPNTGKLAYLEVRREVVRVGNSREEGTRTYLVVWDPPPGIVCNRVGEVPPPGQEPTNGLER